MVSFFSHVLCKCQVPKDASGLAIETEREKMIDQQIFCINSLTNWLSIFIR